MADTPDPGLSGSVPPSPRQSPLARDPDRGRDRAVSRSAPPSRASGVGAGTAGPRAQPAGPDFEPLPTAETPPPPRQAPTFGVVERQTGGDGGPTLVVIGGLHGNERAGVRALERVMNALADEPEPLLRGELLALVGNLVALAAGRRYVERDLNRGWAVAPERGRESAEEPPPESHEAARLHRELASARDRARGPLYLLDLHTTSGLSHPFLNVADSLPSRRFASVFRAPVILGLDEALTGTLMQHAEELGFTCVVFESGQHDDPQAVDFAEAAIWLALAHLSLIDRQRFVEKLERSARLLDTLPLGQRMFEVTYRHALEREAGFRMRPGYQSFQPIHAGQVLAEDAGSEVRADDEAYLLMPLYQPQGDDGFFLMREIGRGRRLLANALRRLRFERLVTLLPGIERIDGEPRTLRLGLRHRRGPIRDLLRLLGYRFEREVDGALVLRRRLLR